MHSTDGADGRLSMVEKSLVRMHCTLAGHRDVTMETEEMGTGTQEGKQGVSS